MFQDIRNPVGGALGAFFQKSSLVLLDILMKRKPGSSELLTLIELSAISKLLISSVVLT